MEPITAGLILGGLSIGSGIMGNKAISKTASSNALATSASLLQNYEVSKNQLQDKANQVNTQLGMELTNLVYQAIEAKGKTTATVSERQAYGQSAARSQNMVGMKKALTADQMIQSAESKLIDVQNEMRNAKYSYESGMMSNTVNFNNTMSQQTGTMGMLSNAFSAGAQGYSFGKDLQ